MKVKNLKTYPIILILLLVFSNVSFAWNAAGHQLMAAITWDLLNSKEQQYWVDVIKHHPRYLKDFKNKIPKYVKFNPKELDAWLFRQAAVWPDIARGLPPKAQEKYHHGPWHYINYPIYLNGKTDTSFLNLNESVTHKLDNNQNIIQALEGNLAILNQQSTTKKQKAIALCWVLHLQGDLLQPLHTTALFSHDYFSKGDKGGNAIAITGQGQIQNLHWYWDSRLNNTTKFKIISLKAKKLIEKLHAFGLKNQQKSITTTAMDAHKQAQKYVYTPVLLNILKSKEIQNKAQPRIYISNTYDKQARKVAERQIIKAGYQTARKLHSIY